MLFLISMSLHVIFFTGNLNTNFKVNLTVTRRVFMVRVGGGGGGKGSLRRLTVKNKSF